MKCLTKLNNNSLDSSNPQPNQISPTIFYNQIISISSQMSFLHLGLFKSGFKLYPHAQIKLKSKRTYYITNSY